MIPCKPDRSGEPERAADRGEQQRLDQQRPADLAAVAAERLADRELRRARNAAHEQQVGKVAAREQQHDAGDDEQSDSAARQDLVDLRMHPHFVEREQRDVAASVDVRKLLSVSRRQALQLAASAFPSDAGCKTRLDAVPVILAAIEIGDRERSADADARDR